MRVAAKIYLGAVIGCGTLVLALSLGRPQWTDPTQFAALLTLALLGSGMKVRLPGVESSMSISFLPILMGTIMLSAGEAAFIAATAAVAQSALRSRTRARLVQVAFNASNLVLCARLASATAHGISALGMNQHSSISAIAAATVYYLTNALLVCGVISVSNSKPFASVWDRTYLLSLPYYASGAVLVVVGLNAGLHADWRPSLLVLPVMLLSYRYYAQWIDSHAKTV
jgi:hypothetical protein